MEETNENTLDDIPTNDISIPKKDDNQLHKMSMVDLASHFERMRQSGKMNPSIDIRDRQINIDN